MYAKASVAKWLRHWVVVPALAGSIPVVRPKETLKMETSKDLEEDLFRKDQPVMFTWIIINCSQVNIPSIFIYT